MKPEIVTTKRSVKLLQVYHNYFQYHKDLKSYTDRKVRTAWKKEINSKSACLKHGRLMMAKSDYHPDLHHCNLIVLNDFNAHSGIEAIQRQRNRWRKDLIAFEEKTDGQIWAHMKHVQYFNLMGSQRNFEIFQVKMNEHQIELHLQYDYYEIGQPKRENFKLCNLEVDLPIEIKINGKLDHSYSSGRERAFKEHSYIFHLIGETHEIELARAPFKGSKKSIPKPMKCVDLMKVLY